MTVNLGSDSKKYAFFEGERRVLSAHFEVEAARFCVALDGTESNISQDQYENSAKFVLDCLIENKIIPSPKEISGIGFRIVAPGSFFTQTKLIDDDYKAKLVSAQEIAPLHLSETIKEIQKWEEFAGGTKFVGVSDSTFHKDLNSLARVYAISSETAKELDVYRFGYHGISISSVLGKYKEMTGVIPSRVVVCHLGSGVSITAVRDGKSFDTSMGFTPLEGVPMNSRIGDIDAGAGIYLEKGLGLSPDQIRDYLNSKCGLLALGGIKKGGVRELIELEKRGNEKAKLALDLFAYKVKKYIGSYIAALGGVDAVIFTATIGERSALMRDRICSDLEEMGISLDQAKNEEMTNNSGFIENGKVKIAVIKTDEMKEIRDEVENGLS